VFFSALKIKIQKHLRALKKEKESERETETNDTQAMTSISLKLESFEKKFTDESDRRQQRSV
jgi:hypothetical protein